MKSEERFAFSTGNIQPRRDVRHPSFPGGFSARSQQGAPRVTECERRDKPASISKPAQASSTLRSTTTHRSRRRRASMLNERRSRIRRSTSGGRVCRRWACRRSRMTSMSACLAKLSFSVAYMRGSRRAMMNRTRRPPGQPRLCSGVAGRRHPLLLISICAAI
jgi:hypothetical protein